MPLFQKKENLSDQDKKLSVVTFCQNRRTAFPYDYEKGLERLSCSGQQTHTVPLKKKPRAYPGS